MSMDYLPPDQMMPSPDGMPPPDGMMLDPREMLRSILEARDELAAPPIDEMGMSEPKQKDQTKDEDFQKIKRWLNQAKSGVAPIQDQFNTYLRYYEGDQWGDADLDNEEKTKLDVRDRITFNRIWVQEANITSRVMASNMTWVAKALDQASEANEGACTDALKAIIEAEDLRDTQEKAVRHMVLFGMGFIEVYFDDFAGQMAYELVSPFAVYPDTTANSLEKCRYLFIRKELAVEDFEERFDCPLELVEWAGASGETAAEDQARELSGSVSDLSELITIWECYTQHGRHKIIFTKETILWEGDNTAANMTWPLKPLCGTSTGLKFWCNGEVSNMIVIQNALNAILTRINVNILNQVASAWLVQGNTTLARVDSTPGAINKIEDLAAIEPIKSPPMTSDVYNFLNILESGFESVSGIRSSMQGAREEGLTSGVGQEAVRQSGEIRISIIIERAIRQFREMGRTTLSLMQKYSNRLRVDKMTLGSEVVTVTPDAFKGKFDVTVESEGPLATEPRLIAELAMRFLQMGAFRDPDFRYVAEAIHWPKWRSWWLEYQQKMKEQQAMQPAQSGMPQGAAPGQPGPMPMPQMTPNAPPVMQ